MKMTYKKAGVDIKTADEFIKNIRKDMCSTHSDLVLKDIGGFGSFFKIPNEYKEPVLVSSTDGVGTKLKVAFLVNKHNTVGIDLVAMNVNDVLCSGARPLFFLNYIATGRIKKNVLVDVIKGITEGCRQAGCSLVGGETAEMPGFYKDNEYDLAGFCVGIVERQKIINCSNISVGDIIIGIESNGLHSNGFSLVRKLFTEKEIKTLWAEELLKPTKIYVKPVLSLIEKISLLGIAHITGGAFFEKITKIIPPGLTPCIKKNSWAVPEIFNTIQTRANISFKEMHRTFNMGVGMVVVVKEKDTNFALTSLKNSGLNTWVLGRVKKGENRIEFVD